MVGLGARARAVATGTDAVRQGAREGKVLCVVIAADCSPTQSRKLVPLLQARGIPFFIRSTRDELGAATGRGPVSAVGFTDPSMARRAAELAAALPAPQD